MKTKPVCYFLTVAILLAETLIIASCFSPWAGDSGNLTLVWGNTSGRWITNQSDLDNYDYIVTLRGPGGTIEKKFANGVPGGSFNVIPGIWNVTIKGYGSLAAGAPGVSYGLLVMGIEQIEVKAGQKKSETINMYNAREINEWSEIDGYLWGDFNSSVLISGSDYRSVMFLINNDLVANSTVGILEYVPVILVAEKDVTIRRDWDFDNYFFNMYPYSGSPIKELTFSLGINGMAGTLTIDGQLRLDSKTMGSSDEPVGIHIRAINPDVCTLYMNNGVTIKGNRFTVSGWDGCGVKMEDDAVFIMNGGTITGNDIGVDNSTGGTFNKYGGTVSGNGVNIKE